MTHHTPQLKNSSERDQANHSHLLQKSITGLFKPAPYRCAPFVSGEPSDTFSCCLPTCGGAGVHSRPGPTQGLLVCRGCPEHAQAIGLLMHGSSSGPRSLLTLKEAFPDPVKEEVKEPYFLNPVFVSPHRSSGPSVPSPLLQKEAATSSLT